MQATFSVSCYMCVTSQQVALICLIQNQSPFSKADTCDKVFSLLNSSSSENLSLTENLDFTPASGPIGVH